MVAPGVGRSPMTSSDAETDFKLIFIIFILLISGTPEDCSHNGSYMAKHDPYMVTHGTSHVVTYIVST